MEDESQQVDAFHERADYWEAQAATASTLY
jgi:hypothetical protein